MLTVLHFLNGQNTNKQTNNHNGIFIIYLTSDLSTSSNSLYSTAHILLLPCCPSARSRDLFNPFCDLISVTPRHTRCFDENPHKRHDVLHLFAGVFIFVVLFICLSVSLVALRLHSNARFKRVSRTMVFPFQSFRKRYRPAVKLSREYTVHTQSNDDLFHYSKWE